MKKIISAWIALGLMLFASSALAADSVNIVVKNRTDGEPVTVGPGSTPELKGNRTMVPLRVIIEQLGVTVHWTGKEAVIANGDATITLRPDSDTAEVDGGAVRLDAKPYLKNDILMVPLRFVAEVFDCNVRYENRTVTIETKPLVIDGVMVHALRQETGMTDMTIINQVVGNSQIEAIYRLFAGYLDERVEAPARYDWHPDLDVPGSYYSIGKYDFVDQDGNSIRRFDVYAPSTGVTEETGYLIHAALEDRWYRFGSEAAQEILNLIEIALSRGYVISTVT